MAWLTLSEATDELRRRLDAMETLTPAQRVLIVEIVYHWQQELQTQKRTPSERRKCSICGDRVPPVYVLDSEKHPTHIMCLSCYRRQFYAEQEELNADWEDLYTYAPAPVQNNLIPFLSEEQERALFKSLGLPMPGEEGELREGQIELFVTKADGLVYEIQVEED